MRFKVAGSPYRRSLRGWWWPEYSKWVKTHLRTELWVIAAGGVSTLVAGLAYWFWFSPEPAVNLANLRAAVITGAIGGASAYCVLLFWKWLSLVLAAPAKVWQRDQEAIARVEAEGPPKAPKRRISDALGLLQEDPRLSADDDFRIFQITEPSPSGLSFAPVQRPDAPYKLYVLIRTRQDLPLPYIELELTSPIYRCHAYYSSPGGGPAAMVHEPVAKRQERVVFKFGKGSLPSGSVCSFMLWSVGPLELIGATECQEVDETWGNWSRF